MKLTNVISVLCMATTFLAHTRPLPYLPQHHHRYHNGHFQKHFLDLSPAGLTTPLFTLPSSQQVYSVFYHRPGFLPSSQFSLWPHFAYFSIFHRFSTPIFSCIFSLVARRWAMVFRCLFNSLFFKNYTFFTRTLAYPCIYKFFMFLTYNYLA